jgi:hypothetical protein
MNITLIPKWRYGHRTYSLFASYMKHPAVVCAVMRHATHINHRRGPATYFNRYQSLASYMFDTVTMYGDPNKKAK